METPSGRRKSIPHRAASCEDLRPGVIIRIADHLECMSTGDAESTQEYIKSILDMRGSSPRDFGFHTAQHADLPDESLLMDENSVLETSPVGKPSRPSDENHEEGKVCVSCGASKTPYWREAWSPTVLLCNACGLRYSKFKRRCLKCCYVPRKEDKSSRQCTQCGGSWS